MATLKIPAKRSRVKPRPADFGDPLEMPKPKKKLRKGQRHAEYQTVGTNWRFLILIGSSRERRGRPKLSEHPERTTVTEVAQGPRRDKP